MRSVCIWLILASIAVAQESPQPLTITKAGYFLTVIGADGTPTFSRLTNVTDLRGDTPTDPDDPTEPDVDRELALKARDWAAAVKDPQGAQAIAIVYAHLRGALGDGMLNYATIWTPVMAATDSALESITAQGDWIAFRERVTEVVTEAQQRGQLQTLQQVTRVLLSIQRGVELSADGSQALGLDKLVEIARRTNEVIDNDAN